MRKWFFLLFLLAPLTSHAQTVDIIWQGNGYIPPFYKGLNLWGQQSLAKFTAIPQGLGNSKSLDYRWSRNGVVLGSLSGVGRDSLTYLDDVFSRAQEIKVEIMNGGDVLASNSVSVRPIQGQIYIYEDNPLYGILFNREVGPAFFFKEAETSFAAMPFFFSGTKRSDHEFTYTWRTNTGSTESGESVTFRTPSGSSGSSAISVNISRTDRLLQSAGRSFLVKFGEQ